MDLSALAKLKLQVMTQALEIYHSIQLFKRLKLRKFTTFVWRETKIDKTWESFNGRFGLKRPTEDLLYPLRIEEKCVVYVKH